MVAKVDKIFLCHQLYQLVKNYLIWILGTEMVSETSVIFNQQTWLTVQEDFINFKFTHKLIKCLKIKDGICRSYFSVAHEVKETVKLHVQM
jgi:hypothetical protein